MVGLGALVMEGLSLLALSMIAQQSDVIRSETHLFDAHRNHRLNPRFQLSAAARDKIHSEDSLRSGHVVDLQAPKKTVRILLLGTSALYGIGSRSPYPDHPALANDETISAYLERSIRGRLVERDAEWDVEVINAGVSAYHTFHHLVYLNSDLLQYHPDVVINLDGHNDFYAQEIHDRWNEYAYSTSILVDEYNGRSFYLCALTGTRSLAPYSNFFNLLERVFRRSWYRKVDQPLVHTPNKSSLLSQPEGGFADVARETYLRDLWQIHQLGKYADYQHCVFLQPEILLEDTNSLTESDREIRRITVDHTPENRAEDMQSIREQLPDLFAEAGIPFYDIGELAAGNAQADDLYLDYCHLTPSGAALTAERMADVVYAMVQTRINEGSPVD